ASLAHLAQARVTGEGRPLRVGTVARLVKAKRLELFLQTMAEIRRAGSVSSGELEVEALVAGDGPERAALERLARDLGLEQVVRFLGRVSQVEEVLREIDVYLVTSVFEGGVSLAVLEAMAAGLPVVATRAGGVAEAVIDGQTGFLVEEQAFGGPGSNGRPSIGRPNIGRGRIGQRHTGRVRSRQGHSGRRANLALAAALADRVQTLLRDSELRLRMGQAGAQRVQEHFVAARAAAETLQAYQRLLTL
ncbi:MAG: glycosyltransferase, partial [Anaerolineae bacterium]